MKTALLVMVHGSPRPESNGAMFDVVEMVKARGVFDFVIVGFMECNEPTIPEAAAQCVAAGAQKVVAVPYFLHSGSHVADDLPTLLEEARENYPDVQWLMGDYLGRDELVADVVAQRVREALV
ncbi:MAG: CbiX/SirB N-terminal domain-containing protein [Armatimonadetes bacterium]|nr:CbiX/SirB N-terminal domain-containing protein [Armatimonadota bacterium]